MRDSGGQRGLRRRLRATGGAASIVVLVALVALIALSSLGIDAGLVWAARTQLQNAADAVALAAAANMIDSDAPAVTLDAAQAAAVDVASQNSAVGTAALDVFDGDLEFGAWDLETRSFDASVNLANPDEVTSVRVTARLDAVANGPVPAFMSRVLGRESFDVRALATAYLGYAGLISPGEIDLPIVIDCCKLKGSDCRQDFCTTITASPPNPCSLDEPQLEGANTVSCLQFHNSEDQNACWTVYDEYSPSVNTAELIDIVQVGNSTEVAAGEEYYIDNGDKTPMITEIMERFYGWGAYAGKPAGTDYYADSDPTLVSDSWVVGLPVVECQTESHCATGSAAEMMGVVCFEIREVLSAPEKIIRGRFLCPSDALFDQCDLGPTGTGGLNFGVRADIPVLVR